MLRRDDYWRELSQYTNILADKLEASQDVDLEDDEYDFDEDIPCTDEAFVEPPARTPVCP